MPNATYYYQFSTLINSWIRDMKVYDVVLCSPFNGFWSEMMQKICARAYETRTLHMNCIGKRWKVIERKTSWMKCDRTMNS